MKHCTISGTKCYMSVDTIFRRMSCVCVFLCSLTNLITASGYQLARPSSTYYADQTPQPTAMLANSTFFEQLKTMEAASLNLQHCPPVSAPFLAFLDECHGPVCLIGDWIGRWVVDDTAKVDVEIKIGEEGGIWGEEGGVVVWKIWMDEQVIIWGTHDTFHMRIRTNSCVETCVETCVESSTELVAAFGAWSVASPTLCLCSI